MFMKRILSVSIALALSGGALAIGGDLHMVQKMTNMGQELQAETWMSGQKLKMAMETPMGKMETIVDAEAGMIYTLMGAQKSYLEMSLDQVVKMAAQQSAAIGEIKVEKTGKNETINGWKCTEYRVTSPAMEMSVWATKDLGIDPKAFYEFNKKLQSNDPLSKSFDPSKIDGFPIRTEGTVKQGGQEMKVVSEVTTVDEKPIPANTFTIPSDYKKMDMGGGNPFAGQGQK